MATKKNRNLIKIPTGNGETVTVSRETLEKTPGKLLELLRGAGTRPVIFGMLREHGYTEEEHQRGWGLVHEVSGFSPAPSYNAVNQHSVAAIVQLDADDERIHTIADACLKHRMPTVHAALLDGLEPGSGMDSVVYTAQLVSRVGALRQGTLPDVTEEQAEQALALLAARGPDEDAWARLAALVAQAQAASTEEAPTPAASRAELEAALRKARAFYDEWSAIARAVITRRDHLILLGLATRRSPKAAEVPEPVTSIAPDAADDETDVTPGVSAPA
jgi:hypothetical protein